MASPEQHRIVAVSCSDHEKDISLTQVSRSKESKTLFLKVVQFMVSKLVQKVVSIQSELSDSMTCPKIIIKSPFSFKA